MFKDILVHLDDGPRAAARLAVAADLARRHGAYLTGLFVGGIPSQDLFFGTGMPMGAGGGLDRLLASLRTANAERAEIAARLFRERQERDGLNGEWRVADGDMAEVLALHARYADLTVLGQPDPENDRDGAGMEAVFTHVLMTAGRPVLAVPHSGTFERIGERVLVAWNASREATRAVNDALPLLRMASKVTVLAIDPKHGIDGHGDVPAADICLHLARHGVKAEAAHTVAKGMGDGDVLLSYAADLGADTIVCGGYGHSRIREMVFGGVTRALLEEMTVPVFISH